MRLPAQFAIRHNGDKTRWLVFDSHGFQLQDEFTANCIVDKHRAEKLLNGAVDDRYELFKVSLTGTKMDK